jgi:outer membrane scaffolding protein for murein synthesis (MipA/OmpV family)
MPRATFASLIVVTALLCSTARADEPQWRISAGPGVLIFPKYPGAADADVFPIVDLDLAYGRLFLNTRHGIGAYLLDSGQRQVGVSLWFRQGRGRDDSDRVARLEPIHAAPAAHAFYTESFGSIAVSASVTQTLAEGGGVTADGSVAWRFQPYKATRMQIGVRAIVGDPRYMRTWFAITPDQARTAGLEEYEVEPGLAAVGAFAAVTHEFSSDWIASAYAGCDVLVGDAADSPVVEREAMPIFVLSIMRRFARR